MQTHLVVGNEACDLDSTASAAVLAWWLSLRSPTQDVLVRGAVDREPFGADHLTRKLLEISGVGISSIVCLKSEDVNKLPSVDGVILVDHNNITKTNHAWWANGQIEGIIDHHAPANDLEKSLTLSWGRLQNGPSLLPPAQRVVIQTDVGSCATLITEYIFADGGNAASSALETAKVIASSQYRALYVTILVDTDFLQGVNTGERDVRAIQTLETCLNMSTSEKERLREGIHAILAQWKQHLNTLSWPELFTMDLKIFKYQRGAVSVPFASLPISFFDAYRGGRCAIEEALGHCDADSPQLFLILCRGEKQKHLLIGSKCSDTHMYRLLSRLRLLALESVDLDALSPAEDKSRQWMMECFEVGRDGPRDGLFAQIAPNLTRKLIEPMLRQELEGRK